MVKYDWLDDPLSSFTSDLHSQQNVLLLADMPRGISGIFSGGDFQAAVVIHRVRDDPLQAIAKSLVVRCF